jgi:hypothetical protein
LQRGLDHAAELVVLGAVGVEHVRVAEGAAPGRADDPVPDVAVRRDLLARLLGGGDVEAQCRDEGYGRLPTKPFVDRVRIALEFRDGDVIEP